MLIAGIIRGFNGVLCWFSAGTCTRHSYVRSESQLGVGWSFGQEGFSLHYKRVRSKFLTVLSCQLFDIVYVSVHVLTNESI